MKAIREKMSLCLILLKIMYKTIQYLNYTFNYYTLHSHMLILGHTTNRYLTPSLKSKKSLPSSREFMKMTPVKVTFYQCEYCRIQIIRQMNMFYKSKLYGVGRFDNRLSPNRLHHFV